MENVCGLSVTEVTEVLASGSAHQILIIDCRPFMAFNQGRIIESINIHCPPILKRRSGGFIALENIVPCEVKRTQLQSGDFPHVLVYDENTHELNQASGDSNLLSVIRSLLKQVEGLTVRFIIGGFDAVRDECPVLCMNQDTPLTHCMRDKLTHKDRRRNSQQNEPAEILPHLYLGDASHSSHRPILDELGITALLNVSSNCGNLFQSHFRYMNIQINDNMDADLISWFPKVIEFIDSVAAERGKVLVHCRAGVSRSATVCIAYIMQKQGLSLDSAFEFVMTRRPVIDPNLNFIQQLQKFEAHLKSQHKLSVPTTSLTCSMQARSAPPPGKSQLPTAFSFSPEKVREHLVFSSDHHDHHEVMDTSSSTPTLVPTSQEQMQQQQNPMVLSTNHPLKSPFRVSKELDLSPCSLSQTAASPNPIRPTALPASRPGSLPLLQISTPLSPLPPKMVEIPVGASFLSPSAHQAPFPTSPLLSIFHEPVEGSEASSGDYANVPKSPSVNRTFSFFSSDIVTCQSLSIPLDMASPRQCRPTTPSALDTNPAPFLASEHAFPSVSVPHSPLSPLGVPLSPLPSCG